MIKVEGECKDQTQREGEERDIENAHARWWCAWEPAERGRAEGRASDGAPPKDRGWGWGDYTRTYMDMHRAKRCRRRSIHR